MGVCLAFFLLVMSVTGFYLIHKKDLPSFKKVAVSNLFIPQKTIKKISKRLSEITFVSVTAGEESDSLLLAGTKTGLNVRQGDLWNRVPRWDGVEIKAIFLGSDRWLAGTKRGLHESIDRGIRWTMLRRGPFKMKKKHDVRTIEASPWAPSELWLGTKGDLYRSLDGGEQWERMSDLLPSEKRSRSITTIAFDSQVEGTVLIGTEGGLYIYKRNGSHAVKILDVFSETSASVTLTLDKYIDRLHTGKLFGGRLWFFYDLTAISVILFVGTGLYIWSYPKIAQKKKWRRQSPAHR